ncbi:MAG: hypothetical protein ACI4V1_03900 [Eubacteriales bacterium]
MINYEVLPKNIFSGEYRAGHCQGIAVDTAKGYVYYSFTTMLVKTDLCGRFIGSVTGLLGHLGCISFHAGDGKVYGSLEYKNDAIGRGILHMLGGGIEIPDAFYIAIFDVDKIDRADMDSADVMRCAFLREVTDDYAADVPLADGTVALHRFGCSGIDGCAIGPDFGGTADGKRHLFVAYGVYLDPKRSDNDYQVLLKYDLDELKRTADVLRQDNMHRSGPACPDAKRFVYTGNTCYGVQNLEYDAASRKYYMAVYRGNKPEFKNPPMFAVDAAAAPVNKVLTGVFPETTGDVLTLDEHGMDGLDFGYGSTGLASLGGGYFYVSHEGRRDEMQYTNVKLYRLDGGTFIPA